MEAYQLYHGGRVMVARGRFAPASILTRGGRIVDVIARGAEKPLLQRDGVSTVDLRGRHVIPGFVDTHFHLRGLALKRLRCDLAGVASVEALVSALEQYAARTDEGAVVGVDWDESTWDSKVFPTREQLDAVSAERPVYARRVCCHVGVVNTAFLQLLDEGEGARDFARFVDADTGLITEDAVYAANRLSAPAREGIAGAFARAFAELHALGVTAVHDIVSTDNLDAYVAGVRAAYAARWRLRIDALLVGSLAELEALRVETSDLDAEWFRAAGIKRFADGSLGARTAALNEPYADADTRGELLLDSQELRRTLERCADRGVTCAVHAIGDRAVDQVLAAVKGIAADERLFRIEHAEVLTEDSLHALASERVFVSTQPNFARNWGGEGGLYQRRLGHKRWSLANPFRALENLGVDFVFGSDGMPPGPLFGIRGATRHPVAGQSIDAASALWRYTELPCRLGRHARPAGRLAPEHLADFVVLSGDPLVADTDSLRVEATVVGGETVFRRS